MAVRAQAIQRGLVLRMTKPMDFIKKAILELWEKEQEP